MTEKRLFLIFAVICLMIYAAYSIWFASSVPPYLQKIGRLQPVNNEDDHYVLYFHTRARSFVAGIPGVSVFFTLEEKEAKTGMSIVIDSRNYTIVIDK